MKKYFLIICFFAGWACSSDYDKQELRLSNEGISEKATFISSPYRSEDEAVALALSAANQLYEVESRTSNHKKVANVKAITATESRSSKLDSLIYVVNFEDNEGFALVPVSSMAEPVLAVTQKGNYNPEKGTQNAGLQYYLNCAVAYTSELPTYPGIDTTDTKPRPFDWTHDQYAVYRDTMAHWGSRSNYRVGVYWGQDGIYGTYCPNGIVGCAPLAIGTIVAYANAGTTSTVEYTFPERTETSETVNWSELISHRGRVSGSSNYNCYEPNPSATHHTLASILRQIGYDCDTDYSQSFGSGTSTYLCRDVLQKFIPSATVGNFTTYTQMSVMTHIDHGLVLMQAYIPQYGVGHIWVGDGYEYIKVSETKWEWDYHKNLWNLLYANQITEYGYTHFVWGYEGDGDGYFSGVVFNVQGISYTTPYYLPVKYIYY